MEKSVFFRKITSLIPPKQSVRRFCLQYGIPEQRFTDWKRGGQVSQKWLEKLSKIFDKPVDWFLKSAEDFRPSHYNQSFGMMTRLLVKAAEDIFRRRDSLTPEEIDSEALRSLERIHQVALVMGSPGTAFQPRGLHEETVAWAARHHVSVIEELLGDERYENSREMLYWLMDVLDRIRVAHEGPGPAELNREVAPARTCTMPLYVSTVAASPIGRRIEEHEYDTIQVLQSRLEARQASTAQGGLIALKLAPKAKSMEPYLMPGDIVVIDVTRGKDLETFEEGAIYAVRMNRQADEISLKRVYKADDTLVLCSDNRDKIKYPDVEAPASDLRQLVVGRYVLTAERPDSVVPRLPDRPGADARGQEQARPVDPESLPWSHPLRRLWSLRRSRDTLAGFLGRSGITWAELHAWVNDPDLDLGARRMEEILDSLKVRGRAKRQWARCGDGPPPVPMGKGAKRHDG
ncbi:MAG: S24 family peptidase [Desulfomonilaceae bacterium]|nr:S24 family peptidase [Desulfomonilaceae bacterium]